MILMMIKNRMEGIIVYPLVQVIFISKYKKTPDDILKGKYRHTWINQNYHLLKLLFVPNELYMCKMLTHVSCVCVCVCVYVCVRIPEL